MAGEEVTNGRSAPYGSRRSVVVSSSGSRGGDKRKTANATLQDLVTVELRWDPSIEAADIGVTAHDGAVTLSGHVPDYWQFVAAEKAVQRVRGVIAVANELDVHLPASSRRDDTDIAETLARTLAHSISLPLGSVHTTVRKGSVTLVSAKRLRA